MLFSEKLQALRKERDLTQEQLAVRASIPVGSLRNLEQGYRLPSWLNVVKIARALEISTDVLAECDETAESPTSPRKKTGRSTAAKNPRGRPRKRE
jgi:transcriptional regulator with XRE-family HTH domain